MPKTTARVWQRYGHLRIYASSGDSELGWYDPRSGHFELKQPALADDFWTAIRGECQRLLQEGRVANLVLPAADAGAGPAQPVTPQPPAAQPVTRAWPATQPVPAPPPAAQPVPAPPAANSKPGAHWQVRDPQWNDLARNAPGEAARAHAKELRARHPLLVPVAKTLGIRTEAESFAIGARGERVVGRKLNRWAARDGWHVLHAVPVGRAGADIDHVVIARFGVVTVNTKTTGTRVWVGEYGMTVGGKTVDYLRKSRAEAVRARRLLARAARFEVPAQPVIVFTGARRFTVRRGGPPDVAVLGSPRALRKWLRKQPAVLAAEQVEAIYRVARDPATWQTRKPRTPGRP